MLYLGSHQADVAQLDRAFGYEPKGSRFESWHPQKRPLSEREGSFFLEKEKKLEIGGEINLKTAVFTAKN